ERSDVYAVGVMLYGMLAGKYPFDGKDMLGLMHAHVETTPPPPSVLVPQIPQSVDAVVMRCLEKDPAKRYQQMKDVAVAFRAAIGPLPASRVDLGALGSDGRAVAHEVDALDAMRTIAEETAPTSAGT